MPEEIRGAIERLFRTDGPIEKKGHPELGVIDLGFGVLKMMVIGLGKREGASQVHRLGLRGMKEVLPAVGRFLVRGGLAVLQENNAGSTAADFRPLIEAAGLSILFVSGGAPVRTADFRMYFIGIARTGDTPPDWVKALRRDGD